MEQWRLIPASLLVVVPFLPCFQKTKQNKTKQQVHHTLTLPFTVKSILRQKKKN